MSLIEEEAKMATTATSPRAPARRWAAAAWHACWEPAEAAERWCRPCARRVESVEVPNRGRGGFPQWGNHTGDGATQLQAVGRLKMK